MKPGPKYWRPAALWAGGSIFAHDNTRHTLAMAYAAVSCPSPEGKFNQARRAEYRQEFDTHVVED
jgi:hypothetical protein